MTTTAPIKPRPTHGAPDADWIAHFQSNPKITKVQEGDEVKSPFQIVLGYKVHNTVAAEYKGTKGTGPKKASSGRRSSANVPSVGRAQLLAYGKAKGVDDLLKLKTIIDEVAADVRKAEQEAKAALEKVKAERAAKEKSVRDRLAPLLADGTMTQSDVDRIASRIHVK